MVRTRAVRRLASVVLACALAAAAVAAVAAEGLVVELRGSPEAMRGRVISADLGGVRVRRDGFVSVVSWDVIRRVRTADGASETPADVAIDASTTELGARVWRARARLEREDWRAAEPLFEALFEEFFDAADGVAPEDGAAAAGRMPSPTGGVIAEGLLRCRLRRGAAELGVEPWLRRVASLEAASASTEPWIGGRIEAEPVIDAATLLSPGLAPMWTPDRALDQLASAAWWDGFADEKAKSETGDGVVSALATLYRASMHAERGEPIDASLSAVSRRRGHPGVELVRDIVVARGGRDAEERDAARRRLAERIAADETPRWVEVWCRAGIGRSLIREPDAGLRRRGMVELMHLPARFASVDPRLAAMALGEIAQTLDELGEPEAASRVRAALADRFGGG